MAVSLRSLPVHQRVWLAAALFALVGLLVQVWRLASLTASYDQGIFTQALWNGLRGHPFESTLSSQLSSAVIHGGELPTVGYHRLGQHFTPLLLLWAPLVGLMGPAGLAVLQVGLVTTAGLVLHRLARHWLPPAPAAMVAVSFYGANAVIGPTWGNFSDLCQLPLLMFLLLLGLEAGPPALVAIPALLIPLVREDTGVVLVGVGLWLLVRRRRRWPLALALIVWGAGWVLLVTAVLMPLFSDDHARRFMVENFGQYLAGRQQASGPEVLATGLAQPLALVRELLSPPDQTLRYLLGQALPLMLVPLIALDSWLLMGLPLLGLLLARGDNNPLGITIRYTFLVVPGLFAGAALWWRQRLALLESRRLRRIWAGCVALSLLFTLTSNPHRSLSWLIPDSLSPWLQVPMAESWAHARQARAAVALIPPDASVSATTHLVPLLARRSVVVRFPFAVSYRDRQGQEQPVEWIALDLGRLRRYAPAFHEDREMLAAALERLQQVRGSYGLREARDGVLILQRGAPDDPAARSGLRLP